MTRSNIKIVSVTHPETAVEQAPTTEAEGMAQVMEEMKVSEPVPPDEPRPKAMPKRKPRAKKAPEPVVESAESDHIEMMPEPEVMPEPVKPPTPPPTPPPSPKAEKVKSEKVQCPDCGRMVSSKTLKYTHKNNCKALKQAPKEEPSAPAPVEQAVAPEPVKEVFTPEPVKDVIEESITQRRVSAHALRLQKRNEKIAKLAAEAF